MTYFGYPHCPGQPRASLHTNYSTAKFEQGIAQWKINNLSKLLMLENNSNHSKLKLIVGKQA